MTRRKKKLLFLAKAFHEAEDEFGDHKSTEFLIMIVCDRHGVSYNTVVDQLAQEAERNKK